MTARNEIALRKIADECEQKFGIKSEIFAADLADENSTNKLVEAVSERKFDVLVNNAGFAVKGDFIETNIIDELKMLNVQLAALLKLTKAVLPEMIRQQSGNILNIASVYSFAPVPKQSVYSASKSFILNFSSALQNEIKDSGVNIAVVCPGITQTEFRTRAGITEKKESGMTAEKVAEISFRGMLNRKQIVVPGWQNKLFVYLARHLSPAFFTKITRLINNSRGVNK